MNNALGLGFVFDAVDLATGVMDRVSAKFIEVEGASSKTAKAIQQNMRQFGLGLTMFGSGGVALGGAVALANVSGIFSKELAAAGAVAGATAAELKLFEQAAFDAGTATPTQAVKSLGDIAQAGYSAADSVKTLIPVLQLAEGSLGKLDPSGAAGLATQTMKAFGIEAADAGPMVDKLLKSVNLFALSADDLPLALGTAARGAGVLRQNLDETLVALGLVKNIIPSVERSSTAVAVAMERMVDPEVAAALRAQGVAVADAQGNFRPFLDIVQDLIPALGRMSTEQQRSGFLVKTFGTEALGGLNAIMTQVTNGIRTNSGELVKGADAVTYLRDAMAGSKGAAKEFADALLNTFEGQKSVAGKAMEALATAVGQPFERTLKPIVSAFVEILRDATAAFRALPEPVKDFIAKAVLLGGVLVTVLGGALAAKAAFGILTVGLSAAGITAGGFLAALAPVVAIVGVATIAVVAFREAINKNIGGLGDFFGGAFAKVSLAFRALGQLFSQGGFSGDVLAELDNGNQGVENFVIRIWGAAKRIEAFFDGLSSGFGAAIDKLQPVFQSFATSLEKLGVSFSSMYEDIDPNEATGQFNDFTKKGEKLGAGLAKVVEVVVEVMTAIVDLAVAIKPTVVAVGDLVGRLGGAETIAKALEIALVVLAARGLASAAIAMGTAAASSVTAALAFGRQLVAVAALAGFNWAGMAAATARALVVMARGALAAQGPLLPLTAMITALYLAYDQLKQLLEEGIGDNGWSKMWDKFQNDIGFITDDELARRQLGRSGVSAELADSNNDPVFRRGGSVRAATAIDEAQAFLAPEPIAPTSSAALASHASSAAAASRLSQEVSDLRAAKQGQTLVNATMVVDGEVLGRISAQAQRSSAARGLGMVSVEEE